MIQYLKEGSFAVNEVLGASWDLLKRHYFSIVGLCLALFLVSNASGILSIYFNQVHVLLSLFMAIFFLVIYAGVQLTLFKYIFNLLDEEKQLTERQDMLPTGKEISYFFVAMLCLAIIVTASFIALAILLLPFIYILNSTAFAVELFGVLSVVFFISFALRVAFYPFFIIDRHEKPLRAIRLSFAITRGNFTKLLLLLTFFAILHLLTLYFSFRGYTILSVGIGLLNSFLVVPLSSVSISVAYRKMMYEYNGDEDPKLINNIL